MIGDIHRLESISAALKKMEQECRSIRTGIQLTIDSLEDELPPDPMPDTEKEHKSDLKTYKDREDYEN